MNRNCTIPAGTALFLAISSSFWDMPAVMAMLWLRPTSRLISFGCSQRTAWGAHRSLASRNRRRDALEISDTYSLLSENSI